MACIMEWEPQGVYWKYSGDVSGREIIKSSTAIYGDSRFDTLKYKLVDFLEVDTIDINKDEITLIAHQHRMAERSNPYIKNAIVLRSNNKLAKEFAAFFIDSTWQVKLFNDLDEANTWLCRSTAFST